MDEERKLITAVLKMKKVDDVLNAWYNKSLKSSEESIEARRKGNELYVKKEHDDIVHEQIWQYYSKSIAKAPSRDPNSLEELARAYGNRSALLQHIGKVKESIDDIDRALKLTKSHALKTKLLNRKIKCKTVLEKSNRQNFEDQNHSVNGMQEIDNRQKNKTSIKDILLKKEAEDIFETIYLKYSEQYGRHIMAKRDIKPGELIMCVKPYVTAVHMINSYAHCGHCMKISWASIPCDYCDWCMFCSEKCKNEAWKKYHDVECQILPKILYKHESVDWKPLVLRLIIVTIREAGSIAKLREELIKVDKTQSKIHKGFINGKFHNNKFQSIYSLSNSISSEKLESSVDQSVLLLISLAKNSSIFGKDVKFENKQDFLRNRDVIFIGSLLLKFMCISIINSHSVTKKSYLCKYLHDEKSWNINRCCEIGICIAGIPSFFNHSCYPNVRKCFSEDNSIIIYAIQPIKKNTQLFDSYIGYYYDKPKTERQLLLQEFNMNCSCPPCKEGWPVLFGNENEFYDYSKHEIIEIAKILMEKYNTFMKSINGDYSNCDLSSVEYLSECIEKATTKLHQPSFITSLLIKTLCKIIDNFMIAN